MEFRSFVHVAQRLPNDISVMIRGPHGIGKSQVVYQLAEYFKLPIVERRLSQMTEGDMIGLPNLDGNVTRFAPPDWFMQCTKEPHVIFLDEINRATPEVMQAAFQLVLDRELNGEKVHPDCRIYAAINASADYQVNEVDPALLDRFWVTDLEPSVEDWLEWSKEHCHPVITDFIRQNPKFLEHRDQIEPGKVYPSRRSWERVSNALNVEAANGEALIDQPGEQGFYGTCLGLLGAPASIAFQSFVQNYDRQISVKDVLNKFETVENKLKKASTDKLNSLIEKIHDHSTDNTWTQKQVDNVVKFMEMLPGELLISLWTKISESNFKNTKKVHKKAAPMILEKVGSVKNLGKDGDKVDEAK